MRTDRPTVAILGTRGIPAEHGGFETFAENLALFLVGRGWHVTVYCQREVDDVRERFSITRWRGIDLVHVEVAAKGPRATLAFDWHCARHAADHRSLCLVLGYNGAVFLPYLRLRGCRVITNMDGIEWRRPKWNAAVKAWFWVSEWIAAWSSHRLVADHPAIADHVATRRSRRRIAMIPYGGDPIGVAPVARVGAMGLAPNGYLLVVARVEPDNSTLQMVEVFSRRARGLRLVVVGRLDESNAYHRAVRAAGSDEVTFPGPIYDPLALGSLRFHARAYLHGHTVGGTNPSLVEALWAGNAVIAHDNVYNRWTAGDDQLYFGDPDELDRAIDLVLRDDLVTRRARHAARLRAATRFGWTDVLSSYEDELRALGGYPARVPAAPAIPRPTRVA